MRECRRTWARYAAVINGFLLKIPASTYAGRVYIFADMSPHGTIATLHAAA
jgi:hypothetical protein